MYTAGASALNFAGDYYSYYDIPPGDTVMCTECLCKGMNKFKKWFTSLQPPTWGNWNQVC